MSSLIRITLLFALVAGLQAGFSPYEDPDDDLLPGDFGKPTVVNPIPGHGNDPSRIDDPFIIIDDEPSEEDEGLIYLDRRHAAFRSMQKQSSTLH